MLTLGFFGLDLTLQTLLKEVVVLTVIRNGSGLVDLALKALHGII